ncbi:MAG: CusA/CzcA family heavy metal efflux RND transporter [Deltaproteobacteria bacterium]|nr:CusA/CzcA family heavy metal efflux RND transporter [Deltaproteobacteria bacterium]
MLNRLIDLSLRFRGVVLLAATFLALAGLVSFQRLPFDAYPDTTPVQVSVNAVAPALSPLEVERQITFPIEQALGGLPRLTEIRSISKFGFSQITAIFDDDTDVYLARQVVGERLRAVELPVGIGRPSLGPVSTGLGEVFQYLVESDELSAQELRTLHHWVVRPQMLQVPGIAEINTWGGYEKQYHVVFDPDLLVKYELTLDDVATALRRNNANTGGGVLDRGGEARIVQGVGLARSTRELAGIVVAARGGVPILIDDVARVEEGHEVRRGAVTAEGRGEAVLGLGFMLMGENSRTLTQRLEARLREVQESLPEGVRLEPVYSRSELVDEVLRTVRDNLLEGALLVIAILFAFLGNLRAGLIVALAIPLSMLFAFNAMLRFGITGSLMSLGAIDFGLVVDSSVIMVENAARRVAEDSSGRSVREVVRDAAVEVRKPTLFGELIIAIVYLPILALEGVEGKLFRPMALTVIFALVGSMILSLTLMPALASLVLRRGRTRHDNRLVRTLQRAYRPVLFWALSRRGLVLGLAAVALGGALALSCRLGSEFVPRLREQAIVINTIRLAGVSLAESVRYGTQIERLLLAEYPDEIAHLWTRTGTAEVATDPMGLEVSDLFLTLTPRRHWRRARTQDELMQRMSTTLEGMPGMRSVFTQPIEMRMNEMIAGIRADVGIKLFGDDFDLLRVKADEIRRVVEQVPGATEVTGEQITGLPILRIEVDREAVARYGIPASEVLELVESLGTHRVGEVIEGQMRFDLVLRLEDRYRDDPRRLERLLVTAADGQRVPLGQLAEIALVEGPSTINREWARRRITVQANVRDRDIGSFVADLRGAIAEVELPPGYYVRYGGQFEHLERARQRLALVVPIALLLIFSLLYLTFGRARDALLVFTGVPFAGVGGVIALLLAGMPFSISAGVGFIAVSGVSVLGQLVLVSRARQLMSAGRDLAEATREAAQTRLRPVLMTALVAALGFVPMALNTGVGAEVQRPLAIVVIGGVITSMLATLIVLPVLYSVFGSPFSAADEETVAERGGEAAPESAV